VRLGKGREKERWDERERGKETNLSKEPERLSFPEGFHEVVGETSHFRSCRESNQPTMKRGKDTPKVSSLP